MAMKQDITDIFFDLDHTLWDFDKNSAITYRGIFDDLGMNLDFERFMQVYAVLNNALWKDFREDRINAEDLRYQRLFKTFESLNIEVKDAEIEIIATQYIANLSKQTHLIDGAIEILDYLKSNYKMHIITNGPHKVQGNKLRNAKLDHYFDVVVDSETVGVKKPNPEIFEAAIARAGVATNQAVMIGDNFEADILGAAKVGLHTICFNYHKEELPNDILQINELKGLKDIL